MKLKLWMISVGFLLLSQLAVAAEKVVVLTSYPQEVVTQFEAAFEQAYPQYRLEILWRQSRDAMSYLHQTHSPVDVYWTPAQRNFAVLAKEGALRKLDIDLKGLPKKLAAFRFRTRMVFTPPVKRRALAWLIILPNCNAWGLLCPVIGKP